MAGGELVALAIGVFGIAGVIFTALKYNRDDTTAVLGQQNTILDEMRGLNDELRQTVTSLRAERDELKTRVSELTGQVELLRREIHELRFDRS
jgi:uncharacterized coiled-coil DUF342 family protein